MATAKRHFIPGSGMQEMGIEYEALLAAKNNDIGPENISFRELNAE